MSVSKGAGRTFDAVTARHRFLVLTGVASTVVGLVVAAFVGYEWVARDVGHEIIAVGAAVALLLGVQILVLTSLSSMLIRLHEELLRQVED